MTFGLRHGDRTMVPATVLPFETRGYRSARVNRLGLFRIGRGEVDD
jgi:hypothetical protein